MKPYVSVNTVNNVPEHVAEELDRLGNSDEGIAMREPSIIEGVEYPLTLSHDPTPTVRCKGRIRSVTDGR